MLGQSFTIARNTFTEAIRQPVFIVLVFAGFVMLFLNPWLAAYTMETGGGDNKMLVDMGLSTLFLMGLLLAAFSATGVLAHEIDSRTVLTVVSKPVPRPVFIVGKFLGVAAAIGLAFYILALIFLLTLRHRVMATASDDLDGPVLVFGFGFALLALATATFGNYFFKWVWASSVALGLAAALTAAYAGVLVFAKNWALQPPLTEFIIDEGLAGQVVWGLVLVFLGVLILTALAVAISTRLGQVATLLICLVVFGMGLVSQSFIRHIDNAVGTTSEAHLAHDHVGIGALHRIEQTWSNSDLKESVRMSLARQSRVFTRENFNNLVGDLPLDDAQRDQAFRAYVTDRRLPEDLADQLADQAALPLGKKVLYTVGAVMYWLTPNLQFLWPADAITMGNPFTASYIARCAAYAGIYVTALLALAVVLFQRREVG